MYEVEEKRMDALRLAGQPHRGAYDGIGAAFEQLSAVVSARDLWPQVLAMAGVYFDDPGSVAEEDLKSFAAVALKPATEVPESLEIHEIESGPHAVLRFKGPYIGLRAAYDYLYGEWLPSSGREFADAPAYEVYLNSPMDTAPEDLLTDICAPLKPL